MPVGVVKTKAQEVAWKAAKEAAAKSKGKSVSDLQDNDWGLVMHIFQNATKSEELPDFIKEELAKIEGMKMTLQKPLSIKDPSKIGKVGIRTPKAKSAPDAFDKPSNFFKKEDFENIKNKNLEEFRKFLEIVHSKRIE
jgi:hypothetical protein